MQAPVQADIQVIVEVFQVLEVQLLAYQHLVEASDEVALEEAALEESLADDPSYELEIPDVLLLDVGLWIGHVR